MKPSIESRARWAFALFLFLSAVAGLAWYFITSGQYTTYQIRTQDSVSGLLVDAPVEFHGVEVGKVKNIELTGPGSVSILLSVKKGTPVTAATIATISARGLATRGFMGYVTISLDDGGTDSQPIAILPGSAFPVIRTAPSRSVNMDTAISQMNENVQLMTDLMRSMLDKKTLASLKQSIDNLQQVTQTLATNNQKLRSIIMNAEHASSQFKPLLESSNDTVRTLQTQLLPEAYRALANMDNLSRSLGNVAGRVNRNPSILIRGSAPPAPGPGEADEGR